MIRGRLEIPAIGVASLRGALPASRAGRSARGG